MLKDVNKQAYRVERSIPVISTETGNDKWCNVTFDRIPRHADDSHFTDLFGRCILFYTSRCYLNVSAFI